MVEISRSMEMQQRARNRIPGLAQLLSKRPDQFSEGVWPGYFSKAKGVEVWDLDGNSYIDMSIGGIGATVLGYADQDVDSAVKAAIDKGVASSLNCPEEVELADLMCEIHPWAEKVRFARTGGESMAMAIRIARAHTGKDKIAFCGYHGWHDWYLAANLGSEDALGQHLLSGLEPAGVPKGLEGTAFPFRYNNLDELNAIVSEHGKDLAAIVMEPIRNSDPAPGFLEGVRTIADEVGAVLIVDEISAGFRLNTGGAHLKLGLRPDVSVFSKSIGNGYAIGAVIGIGNVMDAAQKTFISSTNWTERVGPSAALATIRKYRSCKASDHLVKIGDMVQRGWRDIAKKTCVPVLVSGISPLSHFSFDLSDPYAAKALFVQLMLEQGFLASTLFYAMFAHNKDHVSKYLGAAESAFVRIADASDAGTIESELKGKISSKGFVRLI